VNVRRLVRGSIVTGALALAVSSFGLVGTAYAETPAQELAKPSDVTVAENGLKVESERHFRVRFHSREECERRARIDYDSRRIAWECRRGPDRNGPWELWSD
jgi:hypothetical protein